MLRLIFWTSSALSLIFLLGLLLIFWHSYRDPRWRVFDFNSRQAVEGEIYTVAEVPAVRRVRLVGDRKLRFEFTPRIDAEAWEIRTAEGDFVSRGEHPEIQFPDAPSNHTYRFRPEGASIGKEIAIQIAFYPKEGYARSGLSWPDNYYSPESSVPFSLKQPYSVNDWAGLPEGDPERAEARRILGSAVNPNAPTMDRLKQVFRFVMDSVKDAGGIPTDDLQDASPLKTYTMLSGGTGRGWCENVALVYYLFANAAGIKTRLVDVAGKFGPLKLTGHYFCESWIPERAAWCYVDPQSGVACLTGADGRLLNTLDLKRIVDLNAPALYTALTYDNTTGLLERRASGDFHASAGGYFKGDVVIAYKFGYPKNSTYSKLRNFLFRPTLLYAPFDLPDRYLVKSVCLAGLAVCLGAAILSGLGRAILKP